MEEIWNGELQVLDHKDLRQLGNFPNKIWKIFSPLYNLNLTHVNLPIIKLGMEKSKMVRALLCKKKTKYCIIVLKLKKKSDPIIFFYK